MRMIKLLFLPYLVCLTTLLSFSQIATADTIFAQPNTNPIANIKTFNLELWAPDEQAPLDAKPAEIGDNYRYRYSPEQQAFSSKDTDRVVVFAMDKSSKARYQFRWIAADTPQFTRLLKVKPDEISVGLDDGPLSAQTYFELWVYDRVLNQSFMCDPEVVIRRPPDGNP